MHPYLEISTRYHGLFYTYSQDAWENSSVKRVQEGFDEHESEYEEQ